MQTEKNTTQRKKSKKILKLQRSNKRQKRDTICTVAVNRKAASFLYANVFILIARERSIQRKKKQTHSHASGRKKGKLHESYVKHICCAKLRKLAPQFPSK